MTEQRRGDAPRTHFNALLSLNLDVLVSDLSSGLSVDDLVEAGEDVASRQPLKLDSSLHEEAALRDLASHLLPVASPEEETWVAALAMDADEVEIVVEPSKCCSNFVFHQIASSRCEEMITF